MAKNEVYRSRQPEYRQESDRRYRLKQFGLTPEQYDAKLAEQGGVCAICGGEQVRGKRLAVDHDHETDEVRGLLCNNCNTGIGSLGDNAELLIAAAAYLMEYARG